MRLVVAVGGSQLDSSGGGASALSSWGWVAAAPVHWVWRQVIRYV